MKAQQHPTQSSTSATQDNHNTGSSPHETAQPHSGEVLKQLHFPDARQRQAAAIALQRQLGNAATTRYIQRMRTPTTTSGSGVFIYMPRGTIQHLQRQPEGESASGGDTAAPATLTNARFSGNDTLTRLVQGSIQELTSRHNGPAVQAVQQALFDMGYSLPRYLVDGRFGDETREAIRQFRQDHHLPDGTQFDTAAMVALDGAAPAAGQTRGASLDYSRMLQDNRLTITVAIGYDEGGIHHEKTDQLVDFLLGIGFSGEMGDDGIGTFTKMHTFTYDDPQAQQSVQREVEIRVRMVTPSTTDASAQFERGLSEDDIAIYTGHARYGTGPDFDDKESPAQNFVIGVGSALHESGVLERPPGENASWYRGHRHMEQVLDQRANDLERMTREGTFDPDQYRVWFLSACSTIHYLDELRNPGVAQGLDRGNLDIIGTRSSIYSGVNMSVVISFISSVLAMDNLDQLMAGMQGEVDQYVQDVRAGGEAIEGRPNQFFSDGFGDNPTFTVQP